MLRCSFGHVHKQMFYFTLTFLLFDRNTKNEINPENLMPKKKKTCLSSKLKINGLSNCITELLRHKR